MIKLCFYFSLFLLIACTNGNQAPTQKNFNNSTLLNGDIIFQNSQSNQSKAIELATHSDYSHMGIIYVKDYIYYVLEASNVVKLTPFQDWIKQGEKHHYVVKRLKNDDLLTPDALQKLKTEGEKHLSKSYDLYFEWTDDKMYCSELVWKMYDKALGIKIGKLKHISDFDLSNELVQNKLKERFGNAIPLQEKVISPQDMFESDELVEIVSVN